MKVKTLVPHVGKFRQKAGTILEIDDEVAKLLIKQKIVEEHKERQSKKTKESDE